MFDLLAQQGGSGMHPYTPLIAIFVAMMVMIVVSSRNQKKQQQRHSDWVNSLKKNAKVITKGGIHGVVWSVRDDTIVLKIDEEKGAKLTVSKDAIAGSPSTQDTKK